MTDYTPAKAIVPALLEKIQSVMEAKESFTKGTRKIQAFGDASHTAEVRYNSEYDEFQVHHYKDGKHLGEGPVSYHGDDKQDAIDTAKHSITQGIKEGKVPEGFHKEYHCPYCGKDGFDHEGESCCKENHVREVHVSDTNPEDVRDAVTHKKVDESLDEAANPWKTYERNEDNNAHSKNVHHMAKSLNKIGLASDQDVKNAKTIVDRHMKEGSMYGENLANRTELNKKLWPKFKEIFAPKNESVTEEYSDKNPKIDLHHKETGKYIASTNWSPTVTHAVSAYEEKNPSMKGMVKGFKAPK